MKASSARKKPSQRLDPMQINQLLLPRFDEKAKKVARRAGQGPQRLARRRHRYRRLRCGHRRRVGQGRQGRHSGSPRNQSRRRARYARRQGYFDRSVVARPRTPPWSPVVWVCRAWRAAKPSAWTPRRSCSWPTARPSSRVTSSRSTARPVKCWPAQIATIGPDFDKEVDLVIAASWADEVRRLGVWANADYPKDADPGPQVRRAGHRPVPHRAHVLRSRASARRAPDDPQRQRRAAKLDAVKRAEVELEKRPDFKEFQLAAAAAKKAAKASVEVKEYEGALKKLLPLQRKDFEGIFKAMDGLPVIIRLIDPPLHEFLPSHDELLAEVTTMHVLGKKGKKVEGSRRDAGRRRVDARAEPDAGSARHPLGHHLPRHPEDASPRDLRSGLQHAGQGPRGEARSHDPADRPRQRTEGLAGRARKPSPRP